jgi:hypothetical protein
LYLKSWLILTTGKQELNWDVLDLKNESHRLKSAGSGCGSCRAKFFEEAHFCGSKAQLLANLPKSVSIVFPDVRKSVLGSLSMVPKTPAVLPKYHPETNHKNLN